MLSFPNCKINLGLSITGKRPDNYHEINTIFYPVSLSDALEIISNSTGDQNILSQSGTLIHGSIDQNLCIKAACLLQKDYPELPFFKIHLHKNIPMGAGLGGGSADGAFTLKIINEKFDLALGLDELARYASKLGSDCPFFIYNNPVFASGRGEIFEKISIDLSDYYIWLIYPNIHINTSWAFSQISLNKTPNELKSIIAEPISNWKNILFNDFESAIFKLHPEIKQLKEKMYDQGALYVSMTGSGSAVYGLFETSKLIPKDLFPDNYFYYCAKCI